MDSQQAPQPRSAYDMETQESRFAKQRASVKWLLSKAYNNRVPEFLKDPFYRDHEGQDHLKPQIVVGLGNASIYCQVLSNIYSDPNYQSLNHWSILQTLSRKGVPLNESPDLPLTETVLIQTNPLRINAHMTVIEALMVLYAKEVASSGRISSALERISGRSVSQGAQHHEAALLSWISHVCSALKRRIDYELTNGVGGGNGGGGGTNPAVDEYGQRLQSPTIAPVRDFRELCDGVCLAYLISYYCPKLVPWHSVKFNHVPTIEDSIHNILIVSNFSERSLPYSVFHMTPEDITYMRGAMKQNLVVLLADLFNLFEIHPAKCVCYPGMEQQQVADSAATNEHGIAHRRGFATHPPILAIPELRSGLDSPPGSGGSAGSGGSGNGGAHPRPPFQVTRSPSASTLRKHVSTRDMHDQQQPQYSQHPQQSHQPYHQDQDEGFVVHRSKGVPTLSSMQEPLVPARIRQAKEKTNNDSKAEERGDSIPAGRPSNWEENRKQSFSGRRSRRNSLSEDSQLTIENFGGSQDQLNTIGRFDRERKTSSASLTSVEPVTPARSSIADARGSIQFGYDTDSSGNEKQDRDTEKPTPALRRHNSTNLHSSSVERDIIDGDMSATHGFGGGSGPAGPVSVADVETTPRRKTSFATLPNNTTTWQQQAISVQKMEDVDDSQSGFEDATKISTIKLKLEEKRRLIEQEKRRMETAWSKQLQTVGKQAFLQAINKQGKGGGSMSESDTSKESPESATMMMVEDSITSITTTTNTSTTVDRAERPCSLQDLDDQNKYESKWNAQIIEPKKTPDLENMDLEQYQQSISKMNSNLHDIQADIQRLTQQQTQIQAQTLQAQQLLHAQQIANLLNQQYGSQQNIQQTIHGTYRPINAQLFGSSPHLPQQNAPLLQQQSPINYGTRPPSRDPYLSQQQQLHTLQYVNDQGQYIQQAQQQQQQQQQHYMGYENGQYRKENQYSSNPYLNIDQQQQQFYQDSNHYRDPYLPQEVKEPPIQQSQQPQHNQFFLHDSSGGGGGGGGLGTPPQPAQRRTWAQSAAAAANQRGSSASSDIQLDINAWNQGIKSSPYNKSPSQSGFSLHHNGDSGGDGYGTGSRYGGSQQSFQNLFEVHHGSSSSPQHSRVRNQISQMINHGGSSNSSPGAETRNSHHDSFRDNRNMPLSPPIDDMAPQSISFIGDEDTGDIEINTSKGTSFTLRQQHQQDQLEQLYGSSKPGSNKLQHNNGPELNKHLSKLNITSGNRTYRIPSPTRPTLNSNSFHDPQQDEVNEKGFYISFDNEQPKRPKPPLRTKRSPKKDKLGDGMEHSKESEKPSHRENNQNNFGTFSVKTANSFSANFNEEQVVSRKSIIDSASSPFETAATGSSRASNNNMAATMERDIGERRHLEDVTNHTSTGSNAMNNNNIHHYNNNNGDGYGSENENQRKAKLVIGNDEGNLDPNSVDEMERKKEKIMLLSLQRRQQAEEAKARKEIEAMQRREKEREKEEERARKKEEQFARRQAILEAHKLKKAIEEAEREGKTIDRELLIKHQQSQAQLHQSSRGGDGGMHHQTSSTPAAKMRPQKLSRPRPKTIHVETGSVDLSETSSLSSRGKKGSNSNLTDSDSGLGRATPPRRAPSPGMGPSSRHLPSPSGPGSLPPGLITKRRGFDDGSSDISSTASSMMDYNGPKLYKQPATKSNRGIILNAVEYCVFPGAVNREAKQKVLEKIARSEAKHFLVLFRDAGCQFRALYGYWPENEQIIKLYGTGPSQVDDVMFDKFFKYNSGGKCFSQVHTKHLTVTIDAFTIHNSLWQGKKANLPSKKDMALVI
ncbi:patronin isoform X18 [Aedes aegypti]|uniref:Patronin n=1 Tax=Aedes aegypti TaxID=7159 RepID=A0A6I8TUP4_AEDAE|nr:patronin isoform X18 [Aedes aegypti]